MEIKATLNKPYIETERLDFIVKQNHQNGYEIRETEDVLEAWGYTEEEIKKQQEEQFKKDFFNTSLGYVRRKVHMKDGFIKDFLSDILPLLQVDVPIITYNIDGTQNVGVLVTEQFIQECKQQLMIDFYGALANDN